MRVLNFKEIEIVNAGTGLDCYLTGVDILIGMIATTGALYLASTSILNELPAPIRDFLICGTSVVVGAYAMQSVGTEKDFMRCFF